MSILGTTPVARATRAGRLPAGTGDTGPTSPVRPAVLAALAVSVATVLQTTALPHLAWHGVAANLVLLVVVAGGLVRGSHFGLVLGFAAGLLLDLVPPADHVAGRWALALLVVGYVAGQLRQEAPTRLSMVATVASCSFVGSSLYALSGIVLRDSPAGIPDLLEVVLAGAVYDVLLALLVVPLAVRLLRRGPDRDHR